MIDWRPVVGSSWVAEEAYLPESETILVRFTDGVEWAYSACPVSVWDEFTAIGQSRGKYIHAVLKAKPNGPWAG